jgi:hypothetical protein
MKKSLEGVGAMVLSSYFPIRSVVPFGSLLEVCLGISVSLRYMAIHYRNLTTRFR